MEALKELGERVTVLLERIRFLVQENGDLFEKNKKLCIECDAFRSTIKNDTIQFDQEKKSTKIVVEELIKSIDAMTKSESL